MAEPLLSMADVKNRMRARAALGHLSDEMLRLQRVIDGLRGAPLERAAAAFERLAAEIGRDVAAIPPGAAPLALVDTAEAAP